MKSIIQSLIMMVCLLITGEAMATDMPATAKKHACVACHAIDKKVVGPAWIDVSKKYKGDASAAAKLDAKIAKGGSGNWGSMPMPPNPKVSDTERKELVDFVLGLTK